MGVHIKNSKLVKTENKPSHLHFDLPKDVDKNLKHEINFIIKHNQYLVQHKIKNETD